MSNPTTPFSWQMPTATDLVTDLPADFEVFGQAVATSMADLLGGTTGQVLSKTSNTDMDFTWVTSDDANAIQNTIVDAKGDLIGATAADTPARLAVGTNGQVLTADSSAATGLAWATAASGSTNMAGKNGVLNSNFSIWQRGTSTVLTSTSFVSDRWQAIRSVAGATATRQVTGDTTNLPFIQYCLRVARDSGNTSTSVIALGQNFESINSIPFAGKTVTMSFYARAGANFSAASGVLNTYLTQGTGTDQNNVTGSFTGATQVVNSTATLTTTWQRFTFTGTVASTTTQLGPQWQFTPVGTAGANDYFEVTGVQVEIAASATAYSPNTSTQQAELAACQRYYVRTISTAVFANYAMGIGQAGTTALLQMQVPEMRTAPTVCDFANLCVSDMATNTAVTALFLDSNNTTPRIAFLNATVASGLTVQRPYILRNNNSSAGYVGIGAEL
jgi:hypothetical protein